MRIQILLFTLLLLFACQSKKEETKEENVNHSFFVGTYTAENSKGIYKYALKNDGKLKAIGLMAKTENPSFITFDKNKKYLIAVNELNEEEGTVESYSLTDDSLVLINRSNSGGLHPCYVSANKNNYVLVANYTGGNTALLKIDKEGKLSELLNTQQFSGQGPTDRQKSPHVHSTHFIPGKENSILSVDLGTDKLWLSSINKAINKIEASEPAYLKMDAGAGPRHLAFHPNRSWIYVVNELNSTVSLIKNKDGSLEKINSYSTLPTDYLDDNYCADIHLSLDGKFLYVSNRGHNSIATFKVNEMDGLLDPVSHTNTHGEWPRNFAISPNDEYLLVANQHSNNIASFKRDKTSGQLNFVEKIDAPTPVCILFQ